MALKIGQKVVCIHTFSRNWMDEKYNLKDPVKNEIYTIREIEEGNLRFLEIINPTVPFNGGPKERAWKSDKFRPLDHQFAEDLCAKLCAEENLLKYNQITE